MSCYGFRTPKTVWTNQINIIPIYMKAMAWSMKLLGQFISIEQCGEIMAPLFTESGEQTSRKSGKLMTWKKDTFTETKEAEAALDRSSQDKLWGISLDLCGDARTTRIAESYTSSSGR